VPATALPFDRAKSDAATVSPVTFSRTMAPVPYFLYRKSLPAHEMTAECVLHRSMALMRGGRSRFSPQKGHLIGVVLNLLIDTDAGRVAAGETVVEKHWSAAG